MDARIDAQVFTAPAPHTVTLKAEAGRVALLLVLEGSGEFWLGAAEDTFRPGGLLVCTENEAAALRCLTPVAGGQVTLPASLAAQLWHQAAAACGAAADALPGGYTQFPASAREVAAGCFTLLYGTAGQPGAAPAEVCRLALQALFTCLAGQGAGGAARGGDVIARVRTTVYRHYAQPLSLEELARGNGVTAPYLSALFRRKTGITFSAFLAAVRMERAMALLSGTDDLVIDIAGAVGYSSTSHFDAVFRRHTGQRPLEYRRARRAGRQSSLG